MEPRFLRSASLLRHLLIGAALLAGSVPAQAAENPPANLPAMQSAITPPATLAAPAAPEAAPGAATVQATPTTTAANTSTREILLELGRRTINLVEDGKVVRSWPVAIGDPSTPTPTGRFQVENKVVNPRYASTRSGKVNPSVGPQAPLGDRWIGFKMSGLNQFGIHGTPDAWAWTVNSRSAVSNGCVRMLTPHVRELFEKVDVGTPVVVRP